MNCPLCGGGLGASLRVRDINRGLSDERFEYRRCRDCRSWSLSDIPVDLSRFYPTEYYDPGDVAVPTEVAKLDIVKRHVGAGRLVEIGPGRGGFAEQAQIAGFEVAAIEMDAGACRNLRDRLGIEVVQSDDPASALREIEPADVICMWHVIEHIREPWPVIEQAASALRPGGHLIVATPNPSAFQLRVLRSRWTHIDAPRHLRLISAAALCERAAAHSLREVERLTADRTGRDWNAYGWQQLLRRVPASDKLGSAVALALAPVERGAMRASTYTSVFRDTRSQ